MFLVNNLAKSITQSMPIYNSFGESSESSLSMGLSGFLAVTVASAKLSSGEICVANFIPPANGTRKGKH